MKRQQGLVGMVGYLIILVSSWCFAQSVFAYDPVLAGKVKFSDDFVECRVSTNDAMAVNGDYTYLALKSGIKVINTKDKTQPFVVTEARPSENDDFENLRILASSLTVHDGYLYALTINSQLVLFDLSAPSLPHWISEVGMSRVEKFTVVGEYAYASTWDDSIRKINLTSKVFPYVEKDYTLGINYYTNIGNDNGRLYALCKDNYLKIMHIWGHGPNYYSNPNYRISLNSEANKIIINENFLHVVAKNLYQLMFIKNLSSPKIISNYKYSNSGVEVLNIAAYGDYSFVYAVKNKETADLKIYKITKEADGHSSKLIKQYPVDFMGSYYCDMVAAGDYLHILTCSKDKKSEYQIIKLVELDRIQVNADKQAINKADFLQLNANSISTYLDSQQKPQDITKSVIWDTSNHDIAVINAQGAMFAYSTGEVDVIATYMDGERKMTAKISLTIDNDKKSKKIKFDNTKVKEFLPMFLDKVSGDASEEDLHVIYDVLSKSKKFDTDNEKIKNNILLDIKNKERELKKSILDEIIKKKDNIKDKTLIEDVIELRDEL